MNENNLFLLAAVGFLVWYVLQRQERSRIMAAGDAPAGGIPPRTGPPLDAALGGAIGAGACVVGGAALGAPQVGAALAPLCSALGAKAATYAKEGAVFVGRKIGQGAEEVGKGAAFLGKEVGKGAAFIGEKAYEGGKELLTNPIETSTHLAAGTVRAVDRLVDEAYSNSPTIVKIPLAPVKVATAVASKTAGAIESGAKEVTGAVTGLFKGGPSGADRALADLQAKLKEREEKAAADWQRTGGKVPVPKDKGGKAAPAPATSSPGWQGSATVIPISGPAYGTRTGRAHF